MAESEATTSYDHVHPGTNRHVRPEVLRFFSEYLISSHYDPCLHLLKKGFLGGETSNIFEKISPRFLALQTQRFDRILTNAHIYFQLAWFVSPTRFFRKAKIVGQLDN